MRFYIFQDRGNRGNAAIVLSVAAVKRMGYIIRPFRLVEEERALSEIGLITCVVVVVECGSIRLPSSPLMA